MLFAGPRAATCPSPSKLTATIGTGSTPLQILRLNENEGIQKTRLLQEEEPDTR
jgi:hypothetical protein